MLAVAAAVAAMIATPADAKTRTPSDDSVRYAWLKGCAKKDYRVPCGDWTLTMRSGKVRPLPGTAAVLPKGVSEFNVDTMLSPDGLIAVVEYFAEGGKPSSLVANLKTGKVVRLPRDQSVMSFSPDGQHLLTGRLTDDNTTEFVVFDADGQKTLSQVVPQIVSNNTPIALADDGTTIALIITGQSNKPRLHTYDLASDTVSDAVPLDIPKNEGAQTLYWGTAGAPTLWTGSGDGGTVFSVVKRTVDAGTGATRRLDSFKVRTDPWTLWLPGQ
ncbi:hypothetical protein GCM10023075_23060 [Streptosporangium album]